MRYKYVIIGAGISGITLAQHIANELKEDVLIIEKRNHIGGNCYDYFNEDGILVHKYGPHIFHTNNREAWDYLEKFTDWNYYQHRVLSYVDGNYVSMPINVNTINKLYNLKLSNSEFEKFISTKKHLVKEIKNSEDLILNEVGYDIYEKIFKNYTKKQWDLYPNELDVSVLSRIPVRNNMDSRYFSDKYQGIPKYGYTKMFENMLESTKINILLNTDYKRVIDSIDYDMLIYTGKIDSFFDYKYGKLKYRSLNFQFETLDYESYQEVAVINYPNDYDFSRITEFKKLTGQNCIKTTICREYPSWQGDPYYPVFNKENQELYEVYKKDVEKLDNVIFIGRLAEYKYYNMDAIINNSIDIFNKKLKVHINEK